eukprot:gb/GECG01007575.1/.p1 GENE.gb/GECG01007575.1/~~gb/GECG01007575.1/.p1  ORF type:complete len:347 (+),score=71.34 gb/GECG01007575.1/:1-1041(+)
MSDGMVDSTGDGSSSTVGVVVKTPGSSSSPSHRETMLQVDNSAAAVAWGDGNGSEKTLQSPQRRKANSPGGSSSTKGKQKYSPRGEGQQQPLWNAQDENGDIGLYESDIVETTAAKNASPTTSSNKGSKNLSSPQKTPPSPKKSSSNSSSRDVGPSGNDGSFSSNPVEAQTSKKKKKKSTAVAPVEEGIPEASQESPRNQEVSTVSSSERTLNTNGNGKSPEAETESFQPNPPTQSVRRYEVIDEGGRGHYFSEEDIRQMQLIVDDSTGRNFLYHDDFGYLAVRDTNLTVVEYVEEPLNQRATKISWSDQHGYPLEEVYYSENLHYSDPLSFDPLPPRTETCCTIM